MASPQGLSYNSTMRHSIYAAALAVVLLPSVTHGQADVHKLAEEARALESSGKRSEALAAYQQVLKTDPSSFDAQIGIGRVLDLEGKYAEARSHLQKAVELATDDDVNAALATLAQSYAFEGQAADAAKYYQRAFDRQIGAGALDAAAGTANAIGRVYLETGDLANAEKWYRTGYDTSREMKTQTPEQTDLWDMRWEHAQSRIAARRKQFDGAHAHLDKVRTIVGGGRLAANQQVQYPYLAGYAAFYEGIWTRRLRNLARRARKIRSCSACWRRRTNKRRNRKKLAAWIPAHSRVARSLSADGVRAPACRAAPEVGVRSLCAAIFRR